MSAPKIKILIQRTNGGIIFHQSFGSSNSRLFAFEGELIEYSHSNEVPQSILINILNGGVGVLDWTMGYSKILTSYNNIFKF